MQQTADVDADVKTITAVYLTETILVSGLSCSFAVAEAVETLAADAATDAATAVEMTAVCGSFYFCSSVVDADSNSTLFFLPNTLGAVFGAGGVSVYFYDFSPSFIFIYSSTYISIKSEPEFFMEKKPTRPMTPFDEITTPYSFSILKLLLPYLAPSNQYSLWIMIKFLELRYTISLFKHPEQVSRNHSFGSFPDSPAALLDEITPYLPPEQSQMADTFRNILNIMDMMQMLQPSGDSQTSADSAFSGINPMDLMMGMLSPEQQEMFRSYQNIFAESDTTNPKTGGIENERMDEQSTTEEYGSDQTGTDPYGGSTDTGEDR